MLETSYSTKPNLSLKSLLLTQINKGQYGEREVEREDISLPI